MELQPGRFVLLVTMELVKMTGQGHHYGKVRAKAIQRRVPKERVLARKVRSLARPLALLKEKKLKELAGSSFLDQQYFLNLKRKET